MPLFERQPPRAGPWPSTRWTLLAQMHRKHDPAWQASWQDLVRAYTPPMQGYARRLLSRMRNRPVATDEAEEVVQAFLVACVEKDWLSRADGSRGRFRAFLQALLKRFVLRRLRDESARKRAPAPGASLLPLQDEDVADDPSLQVDDTEEQVAFDREWVAAALERARERLRHHNARYLDVIDDLIAQDGEPSPGLAARLGVREAQLPVLRFRARERFRQMLMDELRATVADQAAFDEEWRALAPYLP